MQERLNNNVEVNPFEKFSNMISEANGLANELQRKGYIDSESDSLKSLREITNSADISRSNDLEKLLYGFRSMNDPFNGRSSDIK